MKFGPDWWALWLRSPDYGLGGIPGGIANFEEKMKLICPDCKQEVRSFVGHACMDKSRGLRIKSRLKKDGPIGDGVALTCVASPPGLTEKMAKAIKSGKLDPRKPGRPLAKDAAKTLAATKPWEKEGVSRRTWYRRLKETK